MLSVLLLQLRNNFALTDAEETILSTANVCRDAYSCSITCFCNGNYKYFDKNEGLPPFNSVMYCNYLYWVSHLLYKNGLCEVADKVYYLNKMLNSVDLFYAIKLPNHWGCEHPVGSVMGRATYGDYFFFYQGCTVGGNHHLEYPILGNNVTMYSNAKILGKSHIGNNVIIAANAYVKDTDIPDNSIVFGQFPNLIIKQNNIEDRFWK